jgi:dihydrofolate synthase/folylpolyglutamate synthase
MGLGSPRKDGAPGHPGEPGVGPDLAPPFTARDEATRWLFSLNRFGIRPGLARIEGLLSDLGHPDKDMPILVTAGTNGKGSTTHILAQLLRDAGHKVATYTSPHLLNVYERIQIDDRSVDPDEFARRVEAIRPLVEKHEASWFETLTALAIQTVREAGVDYLCCETGLGGRLDATNALPAAATLVTTIGLDHQRILGETLPEIAAEKLGLLKRGVPLFCGVDEELRSQVFRSAVTAGSPCHFLDELARWDEAPAEGTPCWDLTLRDRVIAGLPDLGTGAMRRNAALAVLALAELEKIRGERLLPDDIAKSVGNLFLPGRYQQVLAGPDLIVDTAHNEQALRSLLEAFLQRPVSGRRVVVFGVMADKSLPADLADLLTACDHLVGVPVSLPRSLRADEMEGLLAGWGNDVQTWSGSREKWPGCSVAPDLGSALNLLGGALKPEDAVLVTGSCFTVAEVLHRLGFNNLEETRTVRPAADVLVNMGKESS